jgi:NAD(P)-dependent dehydrogenase (short-subunit alcohol dehydrogenase family)
MPVAVITGASRGIGRATALALTRRGFTVGLLARSEAGLEESRALVAERNGAAVALVADVVDPASVERAIAQLVAEAGEVDVLVNNAGALRAVGALWDVHDEDWRADLETSLVGTINLCRAVVPSLLARHTGRIVNVVSYAAFRPAPLEAAYAAAKAAVASLTESLDASLEPQGGRAFAVAPAFTRTAMTDTLTGTAERRAEPPERTAELIALLASGEADALHGRVLHTLDDIPVLIARIEEIRAGELYVPRVRRLPGS